MAETKEKRKEAVNAVKKAVVDTAKTVAIEVADVALDAASEGIKKLKKKVTDAKK